MTRIPWRTKSFGFHVLSYFPASVLYWVQHRITGRSRVNIKNIHPAWSHHFAVAQKVKPTSMIEFGAGKTLAQNLYLSQIITKQTVTDFFPMLNVSMVNEALQQLNKLAPNLQKQPLYGIEDLQRHFNITYQAPLDLRHHRFQRNQFDLCISTNTLEHIPSPDIASLFARLFQILMPGGHVSAVIDYSDHYAHSDPKLNRLNYLRFSDEQWKKHNHGNHWQNRLRHDHYKGIFQKAGFLILSDEAKDYEDAAGLQLERSLLTGDQSDFATTGYWVLQKPDP